MQIVNKIRMHQIAFTICHWQLVISQPDTVKLRLFSAALRLILITYLFAFLSFEYKMSMIRWMFGVKLK